MNRRHPTAKARTWIAVAMSSLLTLAIPASRAYGFSILTCPSLIPDHAYGSQWAKGNYYGVYGYYYTNNPSVPDWQYAFSASHLFSYYDQTGATSDPWYSNTWVEVGYYKGRGQDASYTTPHYYYTYSDNGASYNEVDSTSGPTVGSTYNYQILF